MSSPDPISLLDAGASAEPVSDDRWTLSATGAHDRITLRFPPGPVFLVDGVHDGERHVLPLTADGVGQATATAACWVLPEDPDVGRSGTATAWHVAGGPVTATVHADGVTVVVDASSVSVTAHRPRPHADVDGGAFALELPGGADLADAWAGFYWGTILPCVVERTTAAGYPDPSGYVISTLADKYVGTYPDVDHEFQIKGRLAWGSATDQDIVRRMIELQLRMMREDPEGLWRDPCAVQPDGDREYHVRRGSLDGSANAVMFLVTGNVEVVESVWNLVARSNDLDWLRSVIADLEGATSLVESCVDARGRLWSDVYYEDQVIKDGRETMAAVLAANSLRLLAELEELIAESAADARHERAAGYRALATRLDAAVRAPLPLGHWDPSARRFVDWVDRSGVPHDHVHLLANVLPAVFGVADDDQVEDVIALVDAERDEFQRFPTFLSSRIAEYTDAEIGDGGPYDLCAAGRYWSWDAAFWSWRREGDVLRDQLHRVAAAGAADDWVMGERYDMDHVYYVDGSDWHGAAHYYEYPNVFAWVLVTEYLGVRPSLTADLRVAPRLVDIGRVRLGQAAYQLSYLVRDGWFTLTNEADRERTFELDLSALGSRTSTDRQGDVTETVVLGPGQTVHRVTTTGTPA
ncbi:hypothetical protein [Curtobacterium sp. ZW137]|uniref:hypothetical protein n=1 Tax=Curtobacterium sp. ZW137 TaxID=2485104 RepID=UPI000F99227A|nr:hypothetical protein [Curtobacterium sp. ZW137]ROP63736.1 hypothetical protein EDF55_2500 [Curtobacterium sp. ZW137]